MSFSPCLVALQYSAASCQAPVKRTEAVCFRRPSVSSRLWGWRLIQVMGDAEEQSALQEWEMAATAVLEELTEMNRLLVWVKVLFLTCTKGIRLLIKPVWRFLSARVLLCCFFLNKRNRTAKPVRLKLLCVYESSRGPVKMQTLIQEVCGGHPRFCLSNKLLGVADADGPGTILRAARS